MTDEEKALAIFELRQRGMHPEWIRWFVWHANGWYVDTYFLRYVDAGRYYREPPTVLDYATMRKYGYDPEREEQLTDWRPK